MFYYWSQRLRRHDVGTYLNIYFYIFQYRGKEQFQYDDIHAHHLYIVQILEMQTIAHHFIFIHVFFFFFWGYTKKARKKKMIEFLFARKRWLFPLSKFWFNGCNFKFWLRQREKFIDLSGWGKKQKRFFFQ